MTPVPTTIRGITYPSRAAAARALGRTPAAISLAAVSNNLERVGLQRVRQPRPSRATGWATPCFINSVHYPSIAAAARALGLSHGTVSAAIDAGKTETVGRKKRTYYYAGR